MTPEYRQAISQLKERSVNVYTYSKMQDEFIDYLKSYYEEKIEEIGDLIIVPSVDKYPELAINQMNILNILNELRAEIKKR